MKKGEKGKKKGEKKGGKGDEERKEEGGKPATCLVDLSEHSSSSLSLHCFSHQSNPLSTSLAR